ASAKAKPGRSLASWEWDPDGKLMTRVSAPTRSPVQRSVLVKLQAAPNDGFSSVTPPAPPPRHAQVWAQPSSEGRPSLEGDEVWIHPRETWPRTLRPARLPVCETGASRTLGSGHGWFAAARPACWTVKASWSSSGVSAHSFLHCFTMGSAAFNLQVATPGGKAIDFVGMNESNTRWIQDFRVKAYASPAKLESIDGARYHALLIPSCPGALTDLANSGYLARILEHFSAEQKPICAVGHGVAALCCATKEDKSWVFRDYSLTGPSVCELVREPGFGGLPVIVEDFVKDAGACFSASQPDATHVVLDRHLVTGQNDASTVLAVQNLVFLCGGRK
ncbi:glutamine amidotransferase-like class 1 domain-containing protein 1, partial [Gracilinanus agilis]|uniref:glutamine amidotransferase-like class 1 domain-containing protein 1 n=1 Tax=Gracilinanus agilis TaxID=191870 RepID=UPI001CFD555A